MPTPSGLWCKIQAKLNLVHPNEGSNFYFFFHNTFLPILSLTSDKDVKVFYVEKPHF